MSTSTKRKTDSRDGSSSEVHKAKRDPITTIRSLQKIKEGEQGM